MDREKIILELQAINKTLDGIEDQLNNKKNIEAWSYIDRAYSELTKAIQILKSK